MCLLRILIDSIDNVSLQAMFKKSGDILSCKVVVTGDGKSKGHGFVQFESKEYANATIEKLNGSIIDGKQTYAGKFVSKIDRVLPNPDAKYIIFYIKNLAPKFMWAVM